MTPAQAALGSAWHLLRWYQRVDVLTETSADWSEYVGLVDASVTWKTLSSDESCDTHNSSTSFILYLRESQQIRYSLQHVLLEQDMQKRRDAINDLGKLGIQGSLQLSVAMDMVCSPSTQIFDVKKIY